MAAAAAHALMDWCRRLVLKYVIRFSRYFPAIHRCGTLSIVYDGRKPRDLLITSLCHSLFIHRPVSLIEYSMVAFVEQQLLAVVVMLTSRSSMVNRLQPLSEETPQTSAAWAPPSIRSWCSCCVDCRHVMFLSAVWRRRVDFALWERLTLMLGQRAGWCWTAGTLDGRRIWRPMRKTHLWICGWCDGIGGSRWWIAKRSWVEKNWEHGLVLLTWWAKSDIRNNIFRFILQIKLYK